MKYSFVLCALAAILLSTDGRLPVRKVSTISARKGHSTRIISRKVMNFQRKSNVIPDSPIYNLSPARITPAHNINDRTSINPDTLKLMNALQNMQTQNNLNHRLPKTPAVPTPAQFRRNPIEPQPTEPIKETPSSASTTIYQTIIIPKLVSQKVVDDLLVMISSNNNDNTNNNEEAATVEENAENDAACPPDGGEEKPKPSDEESQPNEEGANTDNVSKEAPQSNGFDEKFIELLKAVFVTAPPETDVANDGETEEDKLAEEEKKEEEIEAKAA